MANWSIYEKKLNINGTSIRDRQINSMKSSITNDFQYSPSYRSAYFNSSQTATNIQVIDTIKANIKTIVMMPEEHINVGDILVFDGFKWLCTEVDKADPVNEYGIVNQINNTLKFYNQNYISSQLFEIPCIFTDGSIDMQEGRFMSLSSGHYQVIIPSGTITKSDLSLRFILNDAPYKIEGISNATNGLVKIELVDDVFNESDNRELGVADWAKYQHVYTISILNGNSISLNQDQPIQLNVECRNNDIIVENPQITYSSSNTNIAIISNTGLISYVATGTATITATYSNVSDTIQLNCVLPLQNNYSVEITGENSISLGQQETYSCQFKNNGLPVVIDGYWFLYADDEINTTLLASIDSSNINSCIVNANSNSQYGYVKLKVQNLSGSIKAFKRIQIKSLI